MKIVFRQQNICRKAFTLIEILIVLSLTTLLFALLLIPLVSAINYTRQAQSLTAAQDAARITRERLTRELSSAAYVFDNTSHPFVLPNGTPTAGDDLYTNFLDLDIPNSTTGTPVPAHAYNAKLDFALPRRNENGLPVDPTTGEPITYSQSGSGSAVIVSPSQVFPAAAGITMVRYWIGLQNPEQAGSYNNPREGHATNADTNTYILYRAQFQPYVKDSATSKYVADTNLFATKADGVTPELDDPDFFRQVSTNDINWLNDTHANYTAGEVTDHNNRLENWIKIAKPVIPGPNVDLILLPHNADNTLDYDSPTGQFPGVAHSGEAHDPVTNTFAPIVNTSVTFKPGTVSGDATPATTTEDIGAGVPLVAGNTGVSFIPTVYTASAQSWSLPYTVTLTPPSAPPGQTAGGATYTVTQDPVTGDTLEYDSSGTGVYDLTKAIPLGTTSYIPVGITADNGTINFDTPSFPNGPANPIAREWAYAPTPDAQGNYQIDLKVNGSNSGPSPLGTIKDATVSSILTARIVPGSVHVYGPDATPGPGQYTAAKPTPLVLYTEASQGSAGGDNQYRVDYANSVIEFLGNADQFGDSANPAPVRVVYDYQANMAPVGTDPLTASSDYTLTPMNVSVNYKTRDLIDISLGVRIYDLSTGRAQVIPSEFKAKIGNSNR